MEVERGILKMCESVGGGGAELKAQNENDRNSELWPKKQTKKGEKKKTIKETERKFNALQGRKIQRGEYFLKVRRPE